MREVFTIEEKIDALVFNGFVEGLSNREIIKRIYEFTNCRFALFDISGQLIMSAPENLSLNELSEDAITLLQEKYSNLFSENAKPEMVIKRSCDSLLLVHSVYAHGRPSAVIISIGNGDTEEASAIYAMNIIAKLHMNSFGAQLPFVSDEGIMKAGLAKILLQDNSHSGDFLNVGSKISSSVSIAPGYVIIDIHAYGNNYFSSLKSAERELVLAFGNCLWMADGRRLVVLMYNIPNDTRKFGAQLSAFMNGVCKRNDISCGISVPFSNLNQRCVYMEQAKNAKKYGSILEPKKLVYSASDMLCELMLADAIKTLGAQVLMLNDINILVEYDKAHKGSFVDTLEAYLANGNRPAIASQQLFIDRSTLAYRLNKISNLLNCDLENELTAKNLKLTIAISRLLQHGIADD